VNQITIGLSGHIDHGKTSIVKSITGKNTDNLKDEINRGMTIDIGFAHLNDKISLIDVPGHEKFIRNMVAGVCSIDFSILVIAADDGIMPQTIEHFEILKILDLSSGIIVINKIDLVDKEWLQLVELEVKNFIKDTFLSSSKIIKISTLTLEGIDLLKEEIFNLSKRKNNKFDREIFRMFVDRVFTKKGFGTVVTGTVLSGSISKGKHLQILPNLEEVNIRGIHSHDSSVDKLTIGDRGAINLQSIDRIHIKRGYHIGEIGYFSIVNNAVVRINTFKEIKHNQRIRVHLGTQEIMARVLFIADYTQKDMPALLKFENNIIVSFKDKFIIRTYSPITTIGGGQILDINITGKWNQIKDYIHKLEKQKSDVNIIKEIIQSEPFSVYLRGDLAKHLSISDKILDKFLCKIKNLIYIGDRNPWILTSSQYNKIIKKIIDILENFHKKNPFINGLLLDQINNTMKIPSVLLKYILLDLCKSEQVKVVNDLYSSYSFTIKLSKENIQISNKLVDILNKEFYKTSGFRELAIQLNKEDTIVKRLLKIENNNNNIIIINGNIIFTKKNYDDLLVKIKNHFKHKNTLNVSEFKNIAQTSRKYAVPLLEYLDKQKITYRFGNERKYNKK